jgi:hypothetical protein
VEDRSRSEAVTVMTAAFSLRAAILVLGGALACACGGGAAKADDTAPNDAATPIVAAQAGKPAAAVSVGQYASAPENPCEWIPAAEVERVVGPLRGTPTRVRSAESADPDPRGTGCLYTLVQQPKLGEGTVTVQVVLVQGVIEENAIGRMRDQFARELSDGAVTTAAPSTASGGRWDYSGRLPNVFIGRQGTIGVHVGTQALDVSSSTLEMLAAAVLDRLPDRPFTLPPDPDLAALAALNPGRPRPPEPSSPDPCALLTRAEAEAVLGPLTVEPYRAAKDSALATPQGESCGYYTTRHRALIITPEWTGGRMLFGMVRGLSGLTAPALGTPGNGASATGPWEKAAASTTGGLHFLKGDRMLTLEYRMSPAAKDGALRLAALAVNRL